jgi:hypothetical protein
MACENSSIFDSPQSKAPPGPVAVAPDNSNSRSSSSIDPSGSSSSAEAASDVSASANTSGMNVPSVHSQALASIQSQLQARNLQQQQQQQAYFATPLQLQQLLLQHQAGGVTPPRLDHQIPSTASNGTSINGGTAATTSAPITNRNVVMPPHGPSVSSAAAKAVELAKLLSVARQLRASQGPPSAINAVMSNGGSSGGSAAAGSAASLQQGDLALELLQRLASRQVGQLLNKHANDSGASQRRSPQPPQHQNPESSSSAYITMNNKTSNSVFCSPVSTTPPLEGITNAAAPKAKMSAEEDSKKSDKNARKHPPDTVVLPCRARGMDVDHNFRVRLLQSVV